MITAGKYTDVRGAVKAAPRPVPQPPAQRLPILRRPAWRDTNHLADSVSRSLEADAKRRGANLFIPKFSKLMTYGDWIWKGLRGDAGWLKAYFEAEKHTAKDRMRAVAKQNHGQRPNPRSDLHWKASVPATEYFRCKRLDKNFWDDDANLRAWKRDNQDAVVNL